MSQCFTDAVRTLFATSTSSLYAEVLSTILINTIISPAPVTIATSSCDLYLTQTPLECASYVTYTTTSFPTGAFVSTITSVETSSVLTGYTVTTIPTSTQFTTSCTKIAEGGETSSSPRAEPTAAPTPTQAPVTTTTPAVIPTTSIKLEVSSAPVTVTNSQGVVSVSVQVQTVSVAVAGNVASNLNTSSSSSPPIGPIVGGAVGGLLIIGCLIGFFIRRKTKKNRAAAQRDEDDYDVYGAGAGRRSPDRGEKVERKRMDLVEEGTSPGTVQPFTYTGVPNAIPYYPQQQQRQHQRHASNASSSGPPSSPYFDAPQSPNSYQSHSSRPTSLTPAQAKALEAHRSRSAQSAEGSGSGGGGGGGGSGAGPSAFREDEEEVVVHEDAGPMRVDLPPVYNDRSGA